MMKKKRMRKPRPESAVPQPDAPPAEEEISTNEVENDVAGEDVAEVVNKKSRPEAKPVNDREGLTSRYEDIILGSGRTLPWLERLEIITPECISVASVNDDLAREAALYDFPIALQLRLIAAICF
jgi:hypothetical protein